MTYEEFKRAFGATVKRLREAQDKTQPELADNVPGLDQGGISRLERGMQGFDSDTLLELANALKVPVYRLFGGADPDIVKQASGLSPEALEIAAEYDRLSPAGHLRFRAAMILAMDQGKRSPPQSKTKAIIVKRGKPRPKPPQKVNQIKRHADELGDD